MVPRTALQKDEQLFPLYRWDNDLPTITHSLRPKQHPHPVQSVSMSCAFLWFLTPACEPESFILKVSVPGPTQTLNTISGDGPRNFYCKCSLSKSNQSCSVISVHGTLFSLDVSVVREVKLKKKTVERDDLKISIRGIPIFCNKKACSVVGLAKMSIKRQVIKNFSPCHNYSTLSFVKVAMDDT